MKHLGSPVQTELGLRSSCLAH